ncbi:MAG: DUF354 domain-containing protein [Proteiniphilum sp.]|nr:DUF354 domain-containing protein [Proteiniphilum sp.]
MKLIIDIGHPAHVHLFKNLAWKLIEKGDKVLFTCRDREHVVHLLRTYGFVYENFGKHYKTLRGKIFGLVKNELQILDTAIRFKPDMFISHGSTIAAHASFVVRKPHIALEDTFNMEQVRLSMPFTDVVLTGDYEHPLLGRKEIRYPGYHELAYLHPNVFTPDETVLDGLGVDKSEKYAIVRFVAWAATHDVGHKGMSYDNKKRLVDSLSKHAKVLISSEGELPPDLKKYQIEIKPEDMHNVMAFAHLFVGESSTMATESAVLGVPAVYVNNSQLGYIKDLERRGLVFSYSESLRDQDSAINKAIEIIRYNNNNKFKLNSERMLMDKIDVTAFLYWFVRTYPSSKEEMTNNASFDFNRFR